MTQSNDSSRLLETLERLLAIPAAELENALSEACNAIGDALHAEKVDAFLYDESRDSLVALGTTSTALSSLQKHLGLDVLQVSNGGRVVEVYQTARTHVTGRLQEDSGELRGIKEALKVQSQIGVAFEVANRRRGVLMIASRHPDLFSPADVAFAESVTRWVGIVARRAELVRGITQNAVEHARRKVGEELMTVLAHDLRNYLSPINARLHLLRLRAQKDSRQDDLRDVDMGLNGVRQLNRLISDILDVARLDQGMFDIDVQPVNLGELVVNSSKALSTPEHELTVDVDEEIIVAADAKRVKQCVANVVANAVQHSPDTASVRLVVRKDIHDAKTWGVLEVHNEGPGIPMEIMPRIFERFIAGPHSRGLGLGLYLAKRIAVAHGGDLFVHSEPNKGARFLLHLPEYQA